MTLSFPNPETAAMTESQRAYLREQAEWGSTAAELTEQERADCRADIDAEVHNTAPGVDLPGYSEDAIRASLARMEAGQ